MEGKPGVKIAVTGAKGLLGWHAAARLHARNCAARYRGETLPYDLVLIDRSRFAAPDMLVGALRDADVVLHFAGVNRASEGDVETANPAIAEQLVAACRAAGVTPHIVYANSTHASGDTPYGRSKHDAGEILGAFAADYTDLVLPHIFGECARPYYNNVTATLIDQIWKREPPTINPEGHVSLLHAGEAAQIAIDAAIAGTTGQIAPQGRSMAILDLHARLEQFHALYTANIFPDLSDPFDLALFNSFRTGGYPAHYPMSLKCHTDARGTLFEASKGGNGGQTFMSTTQPQAKRGDHFHLSKVERFLVVQGDAVIRIRRVLTDEVREYRVSGAAPAAIDMPPLHTHNIENLSDNAVLTLFWTHDMFDPANPDTFADPV